MPKYVIEREIPGIGAVSPQEAVGVAQQSCNVLRKLGPNIQWLHSYIVADKTYCIYIAPAEEMVRQHACQAGFPANAINEVKGIIDPVTGEGYSISKRASPGPPSDWPIDQILSDGRSEEYCEA